MWLNQEGIARWLASFSELVGMIVVRHTTRQRWRRVRRELRRIGILRFLDVLAFRLYYTLVHLNHDRVWQDQRRRELCTKYPVLRNDLPVLYTHSPNTPATEQFIKRYEPDMILANCKTLLKEHIFSLPPKGTFVLHAGVAPEYRNAHGCFWALANRDVEKVGMTLLQADAGADTGPVYGYYSYPFDEVRESHVVIQHRVTLENLDRLQRKLTEIYDGGAVPLDTSGRPSAAWGQPWLTTYLRWKRQARRRKR